MTRWGIMSTAHINRHVLAGAAESPGIEILAVASRDAGRAEAYAAEHGIPRGYGSYERLLADPDIEAVYIPLPNSLHVPWSIRSLEAGKHVLCEKPLSRRMSDVVALFDAADRAGRLCMEAFMWRHNPQTRRLVEFVAGGAIGDLRMVRAAFRFPLRDPDDVRLRPDLDGGSLMDVGCYGVSAVRMLAGEPDRVSAQRVAAPTGVDVRFAGTLSCPGTAGPVLGIVDSALDCPNADELEVIGSSGTIRVNDPWHCREPRLLLRRAGRDDEVIDVVPENSYRLQLENFGAAIRGDQPPLLGRADAVGQARAIEALYRAAWTGQAVRL